MPSSNEDITVLLRKWADVIHIASGNHVNVDLRFAASEIERLRCIIDNVCLAVGHPQSPLVQEE